MASAFWHVLETGRRQVAEGGRRRGAPDMGRESRSPQSWRRTGSPQTLPSPADMAPLGRSGTGSGRGSLKVETQMGVRSPLLRHCRPAHAPPAQHRTPCAPVLHDQSCGDLRRFGGDEGGAGLGEGEGGDRSVNKRVLSPIGEEGQALPPTCPRLRLAPAPHRWTITYRFPSPAANTWERMSPACAPPRLGGAHPSYLTAEAQPFRVVIGAAGKAGRAPRRNPRL